MDGGQSRGENVKERLWTLNPLLQNPGGIFIQEQGNTGVRFSTEKEAEPHTQISGPVS